MAAETQEAVERAQGDSTVVLYSWIPSFLHSWRDTAAEEDVTIKKSGEGGGRFENR